MAGKIFLSYRRGDAPGFAGRIYDRLEQSFPAENLFMDVEGGIRAGQDFVRVLEQEVSICDVMLVLIGPDWLAAADEQGRRRLDNPQDFVRIEVESALRLSKRVIPVLLQKAEMPRANALPGLLEELSRRNAVGVSHERFKADAHGLINALEDALAEVEEARCLGLAEADAPEQRREIEQAARAGRVDRPEKDRARLRALVGLSPEMIAKVELANWEFVKASESSQEFRDHLARFPQGVTERMAWTRLEALVWAELPPPANGDALRGFLEEFPKGAHASEASAKLAELDSWASASAAGTLAALEDFRRNWPQSKYADAARTRIETRLIRTLTGHIDGVRSVAFSPNGRRALSGSVDETLRLWDVATGKEIRTFARTGTVKSVAFSPDGRTALSSDDQTLLKLWDVATGKKIRSFAGHTKRVKSVAFSPDGRTALSGSEDKILKLWDVATGKEIRSFTGHNTWLTSVAFSPDGRMALSGSGDQTLKLWDVATGKEIRSFTGHNTWPTSVAFSPDSRMALSGSGDQTLKLWDVATGKEIRTFAGHTKGVASVVFSPDGRTALSGSEDQTLRLWDVATGKEIRSFAGHAGTVTSVAFSPNGRTALSGSWDKTLKLWDVTAGH